MVAVTWSCASDPLALMDEPLISVCAVGGNAVSAFLSWRLQATNACDVTLVWKSGFDQVSQYGISMRSKVFGNERFKPRHVVRTPEEASGLPGAFDYVLLCVKALPDVYDLASVIESVVTPQHTCILLNTTNTLGIEAELEKRFRTNIVLSLVSEAEITQLGASEFEHHGSSEIWVGPANQNPSIPAAIQSDMAEALAMTLASGQVDCKVSTNIRQQQYERMIGPIAFHPASVLFETPAHPELMEKVGVRMLIEDVIDELISIASRQHCQFSDQFKPRVIQTMLQVTDNHSIMYQDFMSRRPMEVETYLGVPVQLAKELGLDVPRLQTLYALLHHINQINQTRPPAGALPPPAAGPYPPRLSSGPPPRPMMNGHGPRPGRPPSGLAPLPAPPGGPGMRRGPPPPPMMNGHPNGHPPRGPPPMGNGYPPPRNGGPPAPSSRRISVDASELEEFGHLMLYDNIPEGETVDGPPPMKMNGHQNGSTSELALRERELALRQREMALREQEFQMRRGGGGRRPPPAPPSQVAGFDEDDDDDYFDASSPRGPPAPAIDPDNFDMMSVTSRRTRKAPSASQLRKNPESSRSSGIGGRLGMSSRNRASARMVQDIPGLHESLMNNPLMGFSSNRYGTVDRKAMADESRTNSLTAARLEELQHAGGANGVGGGHHGPPPPHMTPRRTSQSPGNPYGPASARPTPHHNRRSPPGGVNGGGYPPPPGASASYGSSPYAAAEAVRQPIPRYPAGQGNSVAPQQVEQRAGQGMISHTGGVSSQTIRPPIKKMMISSSTMMNTRSLTGSASASAGSGSNNDGSGGSSGSASASASVSTSLHPTPVDSSNENSAASSQSSLLKRPSRFGMNGGIGMTNAGPTAVIPVVGVR